MLKQFITIFILLVVQRCIAEKGKFDDQGRKLLQSQNLLWFYTKIDEVCQQEVQGELPRNQQQIAEICVSIDPYNPGTDPSVTNNCFSEDIFTNSVVAPEGRFPYYVSLQQQIQEGNGIVRYKHFCGGTLISQNYVVSAARCIWQVGGRDFRGQVEGSGKGVLKEDTVFLALGPYCRHQSGIQRVPATEFFMPSNYTGQPQTGDDIVLLKATVPFDYNGPFPAFQETQQYVYGSQEIVSTIGHGVQDNEQLGQIESEVVPLGLAFLKYLQEKDCDNQLQQFDLLPDKMVCYQNLAEDTCFGDYGSPIVVVADGQNYGASVFDDPSQDRIIGITSFSADLALPCVQGLPGIYTRLANYVDWINSITQQQKTSLLVSRADFIPDSLRQFQGAPQFCFLEADRGPGEANIKSWYYDAISEQCLEFYYGGLPGNDNNFFSLQECENTCMNLI